MSRVLRSILVAVVAFVLAACAGLPTSSDVEARRPISDAPSAPPANVEFYGPRSNADPVETVKGFLRANGSVDEDFAVARQFLTTDASRGWAPGGRVAINQGERDFAVTQVTPGRVSLTATQWAELDAGGHLRQLAVPSHRTVDIGLKQVDGQWRISQLPADFGPYLSMRDFRDRMYTPYTVYLAERRTRTLVPDQQWFPRTDSLQPSPAPCCAARRNGWHGRRARRPTSTRCRAVRASRSTPSRSIRTESRPST